MASCIPQGAEGTVDRLESQVEEQRLEREFGGISSKGWRL